VPRVVIRYEYPDGSVKLSDSRPAVDGEDITEVVVQFVGASASHDRFNRGLEANAEVTAR
jgi:hypothetical protein